MSLATVRAPRRLVVASVIVLAGAVAVVASHRERAQDVAHALAGLPIVAAASAFFLILTQQGCQACRLWLLLPRAAGLSFTRTARAFMLGEWANIFAPARAGDALKILLLSRTGSGAEAPAAPGRGSISIPRAMGAVLADKVVDATAIVVLTAGAAEWTGIWTALPRARLPGPAGALAVALVAGLVVLGLRATRSRWFGRFARWRHELGRALAVLAVPRHVLPAVAASLGAWIVEAVALRVLTHALGFPLAVPYLILAIAALNLGISVPVTVGNVGVYEAVLAFGLSRAGVPAAAAIAIATAHHGLELLATNVATVALTLGAARVPRLCPLRAEGARGLGP